MLFREASGLKFRGLGFGGAMDVQLAGAAAQQGSSAGLMGPGPCRKASERSVAWTDGATRATWTRSGRSVSSSGPTGW